MTRIAVCSLKAVCTTHKKGLTQLPLIVKVAVTHTFVGQKRAEGKVQHRHSLSLVPGPSQEIV